MIETAARSLYRTRLVRGSVPVLAFALIGCGRAEPRSEIVFNGAARVQRNIPYATESRAQRFDLYEPTATTGAVPLIVHVHGGGWMTGKKEESAAAIAPYLAAGWAVADVEYRLGFEAPAPAALEDVACAVRRIPGLIAAPGVRTDSVTLIGESAGGHLVLTAAMRNLATPDSSGCGPVPPLRAIIAWAPPTDLPALLVGPDRRGWAEGWMGADTVHRDGRARALSPISLVRAGLPSVLLVHGDADQTVPYGQSTRFVDAMRAAGNAITLITLSGEDHGPYRAGAAATAWSGVLRFLAQPH